MSKKNHRFVVSASGIVGALLAVALTIPGTALADDGVTAPAPTDVTQTTDESMSVDTTQNSATDTDSAQSAQSNTDQDTTNDPLHTDESTDAATATNTDAATEENNTTDSDAEDTAVQNQSSDDASAPAEDEAVSVPAEGPTASVQENPQHMWVAGADQQEQNDMARSRMRSVTRGPSWSTGTNSKTFTQGNGTVFASAGALVIDVSQWQGTIDWNKVKASGVDGVILRLGFCNNLDPYFVRNLQEVRRLGIPYGIYLYSYAANAEWANIEANFVVSKLNEYRMTDMSYPVFYDLEDWKPWTENGATYRHPTSPSGYLPVVNTFFSKLNGAGYSNVQIYSYLNYLKNELNDPTIQSKAGWVAQYGQNCDYTFPNYFGLRGWQYTSSGSVDGISGNVDMSAFGTTPAAPSSKYTGWVDNNGNRFYFSNGKLVTNKELNLNGQWYYVNAQGLMVYNRVIHLNSSGGKWVYYDANGRMVKGERHISYDAEHTGWYYFNTSTGAMAHGVTRVSSNGGKWVYYDIVTGKMQYGQKYLNYDKDHTGWYYFMPSTGAMVHGDFYLTDDAKWVRYNLVTGIMVKGLQKQDGAYYYFNPVTGKRASGKTWVPEWDAYAWFDATTGKYTGQRSTE